MSYLDDYSDSSDDDGAENTVGNVPMWWYDEYDHIGYDRRGARIARPAAASTGDSIDEFLKKTDDPLYLRTVWDEKHQRDVVLTEADMRLVRHLQQRRFEPDFDPYRVYPSTMEIDEVHPMTNRPEPKRRFQPSKWEAKRVAYLVRAIEKGWIKVDEEPRDKAREARERKVYMMWQGDERLDDRFVKDHIPAPSARLPGHEESYNPSAEYLPTDDERRAFDALDKEERGARFLPQRYASLREVPLYKNTMRDRFDRCLDLYLCPRSERLRPRSVDKAEQLLPSIPKPSELRPFPTVESLVFRGHTALVRCISVHPSGAWLLSGSEDCSVRLWCVRSARCYRRWRFDHPVSSVAWCPRADVALFAAAVSATVFLINAGIGAAAMQRTDEYLGLNDAEPPQTQTPTASTADKKKKKPTKNDGAVRWSLESIEGEARSNSNNNNNNDNKKNKEEGEKDAEEEEEEDDDDDDETTVEARRRRAAEEDSRPPAVGDVQATIANGYASGVRMRLAHRRTVESVVWHRGGFFLATVSPRATGREMVAVHQLTRRMSQYPFKRGSFGDGGGAEQVCFHPTKPYFLVATKTNLRLYDLQAQKLIKKLQSGLQYISSVAIHPGGNNIICSSYCKKVSWFDLDYSTRPYEVLRFHRRAVRRATFHPRYPLFASCGDDGLSNVYHATVYDDDFTMNPLLVPVKVLRGHDVVDELGVVDCAWHPHQPFLFTAGADKTIRLFV